MFKKNCWPTYFWIAFAAVGILMYPYAGAAAQAGIQEDTNYNFGTVKQGEKVVHTFYIKNTRPVPLKIAHVDLSSPGMTTRVKPVITPGSAGEMEIVWNTANVARDVEARAIIHFVGDQQPDLTFVLSGRVMPEIEAIPLAGFYISVFSDEAAERMITLVNHRDHPLVMHKVAAHSSLFDASMENPTPGQVYRLMVRVPSGLQPGRYSETIDLETDDRNNPLIHVPVNIFVKDVIYATPSVVDFGQIDIAQLQAHPDLLENFKKTVIIRKRLGQFEIKAISSDIPELYVTHTPESANDSFEMQLGLQLDCLRKGAFSGTIRVFTTDDAVPEIIIATRGDIK